MFFRYFIEKIVIFIGIIYKNKRIVGRDRSLDIIFLKHKIEHVLFIVIYNLLFNS